MTFTTLHPTRRYLLDAIRRDDRAINIHEDIDAALLAELDRNARAVCCGLLPSLYDEADEPFTGAAMREAGAR